MPTDKPRYTITVDPDLQQQIEDFQFNNRFKSQTKAIIALMEYGLKKIQADMPVPQNQPAAEKCSPDEQKLIDDYRAFNDQGKEKVREYVADLKENPKYKKGGVSVEYSR